MSEATPSFFLTGASGFVGARVRRLLAERGISSVTCLTRDPSALVASVHWRPRWRAIPGELPGATDLASLLDERTVVINLAGAAGKTAPSQMHRLHFQGTRELARAAHDAGASRLVHVSSVAAGYRDKKYSAYATSKADGEAVVRELFPSATIVRPTMVFGAGSSNQASLQRLALLPVPVVFGDGSTRVQPVDVDDLAERLVLLALSDTARGRRVDVGGPEVLRVDALLSRMRALLGRAPRAPMRIPISVVRRALAAVEPVLRPILPFTAGQLAAFVNDSVATPHDVAILNELKATPLDTMIKLGTTRA